MTSDRGPQTFKNNNAVTLSERATKLIQDCLRCKDSEGNVWCIFAYVRQLVQDSSGNTQKEIGPGIVWTEYAEEAVPTKSRIQIGEAIFAVVSPIGEEAKQIFLDVGENGIYVLKSD